MCGQCHKLFGQGGDVGPDLTGSDRANPDYILENVLDPSASVGRDYTLTTVATRDGRLVAGILREQSPAALVIQTASERITLPREDVEAIKTSHDLDDARGPARPPDAAGDPRPVRLPGDDQAAGGRTDGSPRRNELHADGRSNGPITMTTETDRDSDEPVGRALRSFLV